MQGKPETMDKIASDLRGALDRVYDELHRVEFLAAALSGFSKPIPDYDMPFQHFSLPRASNPMQKDAENDTRLRHVFGLDSGRFRS